MNIRLNKRVVYRVIDGEALIFSIDKRIFFLLNESATYVFDLIARNFKKDSIIKKYSTKFRCSLEESEKDIGLLLDNLNKNKIIA